MTPKVSAQQQQLTGLPPYGALERTGRLVLRRSQRRSTAVLRWSRCTGAGGGRGGARDQDFQAAPSVLGTSAARTELVHGHSFAVPTWTGFTHREALSQTGHLTDRYILQAGTSCRQDISWMGHLMDGTFRRYARSRRAEVTLPGSILQQLPQGCP